MDKELKNIVKNAVILLAAIAAIGWIKSDFKTYIGLIVGGIVSITNFLLMYRDAYNVVKGNGKNAVRIKLTGYAFRFFIMFITLFIMMKIEVKSFFAAVAGFFLIRVVIYMREFFKVIKKFLEKHR